MAIIPKQKSAIWALAAAGGMWAWQNRDKIQGYLKQSGILEQLQQATQNSNTSHRRPVTTIDVEPVVNNAPVTGETRRISEMDMGGEFTNETKTKYDPSI